MNRKSKGSATASIVLFVTSGLMASVLGLRQYDRATTTDSWVTSIPLKAGQILTPAALKPARVKQDRIGIENPKQLVGQQLKVNKGAGETLQPGELAPPARAKSKTLAQHVPEGRVLYSLPVSDPSTLPLSQLHGGDRLDILVRGRYGVRTAATDVRLIGVMRPRTPGSRATDSQSITSLLPQKSNRSNSAVGATTLILAVDPNHVYPLAHIGQQDAISLVLHSARDVASGRAVSVTPSKTERAVEVMAGLDRSTVFVKR